MAEAVEPVVRQNGKIIRISAVWERGGIFRETITCDEILNPLASLLGTDIEFVLNRHNHIYLRDAGSTSFAWVASRCPPLVSDDRDCFDLSGRNKFRERLHAHCAWIAPSARFCASSKTKRASAKLRRTKRFRYRCRQAACWLLIA